MKIIKDGPGQEGDGKITIFVMLDGETKPDSEKKG